MNAAAPTHGSNQIIFEKAADQLIVATYDNGVLVVHGWTVSISLDYVKKYVESFGRNSMKRWRAGFSSKKATS